MDVKCVSERKEGEIYFVSTLLLNGVMEADSGKNPTLVKLEIFFLLVTPLNE